MENQTGIVLSGGGVRSMAHIGLLEALEEYGVTPHYISGSSAGALVGSLYAAGYSYSDMIEFFKTTPVFSFSFYSVNKPGLLDIEKYVGFFEKYFPENSFEALKKKLFICTTNISKAEYHIFSSGELILPLLASAALPPIFTPVNLDGHLHSDGGIMNNFPVEPLRKYCNKILGCNATPVEFTEQEKLKTSFQVFWRSTELTYLSQYKHKFELCDFILQPKDLEKIHILDTKSIDKAYQLGYDAAKEAIENLLHHNAGTSAQTLLCRLTGKPLFLE